MSLPSTTCGIAPVDFTQCYAACSFDMVLCCLMTFCGVYFVDSHNVMLPVDLT